MRLDPAAAILLSGLVLVQTSAAAASPKPDPAPDAWTVEKCARYGRAFADLSKAFDAPDITDGFIRGNRDFIAAGCSNGADICPTSPGDMEFANALTLMAMNGGAASSFLPFICRISPMAPASPKRPCVPAENAPYAG